MIQHTMKEAFILELEKEFGLSHETKTQLMPSLDRIFDEKVSKVSRSKMLDAVKSYLKLNIKIKENVAEALSHSQEYSKGIQVLSGRIKDWLESFNEVKNRVDELQTEVNKMIKPTVH